MSAPRTKRQFAGASADPAQRQITSFFSTSSAGPENAASHTESRQPALPSSVQSNLLSVGMRIRKSVPEGYKTVGPSAFKLWTDNSPVATPPTNMTSMTTSSARAKMGGASRELLPFCGINKVGGLDTQPAFDHDDDYDYQVPDLDSVPELTMSQESAPDYSSRKRLHEEEEEEEDVAASPASFVPTGSETGRAMAVPRSRAMKKGVSFKSSGPNGADFEDADFLVFGEDRHMEMS